MTTQRDTDRSGNEQTNLTYNGYEGEPAYVYRRDSAPDEQFLGNASREKIYVTRGDNTNLFRLLTFITAVIALLIFAFFCLLIVGGTGGWIGFCAASLAILTIASTSIGIKRDGEK